MSKIIIVASLFFLLACGHKKEDLLPYHKVSFEKGVAESVAEADRITALALWDMVRLLRPGLKEQFYKTRIYEDFRGEGSDEDMAFDTIVGSGPNSLDLHYSGGSRVLQDGDLVVMDIGAKSGGYCADLTRTFPASGKFTPRQKEVYRLVLEVQTKVAKAAQYRKHSLNDLDSMARGFFRESPLRADGRTMDNFFVHGLSHFLGRVVHDGGDTGAPLEAGKIFTIEPGLYIESEGFGIRIEDDFIMTEQGLKNLNPIHLLSDPDEIEKEMDGPVPL